MKINRIKKILEEDENIFLSFSGFLTQMIIVSMSEELEKELESNNLDKGVFNNIVIIFIELAQNIMNYSKSKVKESNEVNSEGSIMVAKDEKENYYIYSQNIVTCEDKKKIELKLNDISTLDYSEIKKKYLELRRSGKNAHDKGAGIGFCEIAKRSSEVVYEFKEINDNKYNFYFISRVNIRKGK